MPRIKSVVNSFCAVVEDWSPEDGSCTKDAVIKRVQQDIKVQDAYCFTMLQGMLNRGELQLVEGCLRANPVQMNMFTFKPLE
jgi:hypothetical protein